MSERRVRPTAGRPVAVAVGLLLAASGCTASHGGSSGSPSAGRFTGSTTAGAATPLPAPAIPAPAIPAPATSRRSAGTPTPPLPAPLDGPLRARHPGAAVLAGDVTHVPHAAPIPKPSDAADDGSAYVSGPGGCQTTRLSATPVVCSYGDTKRPTRTVAVVGDSTAGQWFTALEAIATAQHWRLVLMLHSLCPWTSTMLRQPGQDGDYIACRNWGATVLRDLLTRIKPVAVITAARPAVATPSNPSIGPAAFAQIADGLETYWTTLHRHGIPVVAMRETPEMGIDVPDCLTGGGSVDSCGRPASSAILSDAPMALATRALPHAATLIDMNRYICAPHTCAPVVGNVVVYRDEHHLTRTYVASLTPYLRAKLLAVPALRP